MIPLIDGFYLYCEMLRGLIYLRRKQEGGDGFLTLGKYRSIHAALEDAKDVILIFRIAEQGGASLEEAFSIENDISNEMDILEGRDAPW